MTHTEKPTMAGGLSERSGLALVTETTLFGVLNVLAIYGNVLVCCAVYRHRRANTITNLFVAALAASDLIFALFVMPFTTFAFAVGSWQTGRVHCLFQGFCFLTFTTTSLQTMCLIAINRYVCVVRPDRYKRIFTVRNTLGLLAAAWLLSCGVSISPLFWGREDYSFHAGKGHCLYPFEINLAYTLPLGIVFIGFPFVGMTFCYYRVLIEVRRANRLHPDGGNARVTTVRQSIEEVKITKTVSLVFLGFALCWIPVGVADFVDVARGYASHPREVYVFQTFVTFLSSTINPLIYGLTSRKFRREYKRLTCWWRS